MVGQGTMMMNVQWCSNKPKDTAMMMETNDVIKSINKELENQGISALKECYGGWHLDYHHPRFIIMSSTNSLTLWDCHGEVNKRISTLQMPAQSNCVTSFAQDVAKFALSIVRNQ